MFHMGFGHPFSLMHAYICQAAVAQRSLMVVHGGFFLHPNKVELKKGGQVYMGGAPHDRSYCYQIDSDEKGGDFFSVAPFCRALHTVCTLCT